MWFALLVLSCCRTCSFPPTRNQARSAEVFLVYLLAGYCGIVRWRYVTLGPPGSRCALA